MDNPRIMLNQFFNYTREGLPQDTLSAIESTGCMASLKRKVAQDAAEIRWPLAFSGIIDKVEAILDIDLVEILVAAWKKRGEMSKYADTQEYPPGEMVFVPLLEHTVVSKHMPRIEVLVDGLEVGRIQFEIDVALEIEGAVLKIDGGSILGLSTGRCRGRGTVSCEGVTLLDRQTQALELPGSLVFDPGIPIA